MKSLFGVGAFLAVAIGYASGTTAAEPTCPSSDQLSAKTLTGPELIACIKEMRGKIDLLEGRAPVPGPRGLPATISTRFFIYRFSDVRQAAEIPRSKGAALCALAGIDDDTNNGACYISNRDGSWLMRTGSGSGDQICEAVCLFVDSK